MSSSFPKKYPCRHTKFKAEYIPLAVHQLRDHLASMKWLIEILIEEEAGKLNKDQKGLVKAVYESNKGMIDLVNNLLNVFKIENGKMAVKPELTDLVELSKRVIKQIKPLTEQKKQKFAFKADGPLLPVKTDPVLIKHVIQNVLSNAVQYTRPKGRIHFSLNLSDNNILFTIKDNGCGIPRKQQQSVFKKFFRADNAVKIKAEGNGLGLYIAKRIIKLLRGRIWFESVENKGSAFYFTLPLKRET
ncbi:MAG: HAMP domain-containing histidine kinase [Candidatus Doudnabacteria bacterium]|nr:HAMP domain-containing histidine kinase [Candidatus Doudnabacteria bacterium]